MLGLEELWRGPAVLDLEGGVITHKISHAPQNSSGSTQQQRLREVKKPWPRPHSQTQARLPPQSRCLEQ